MTAYLKGEAEPRHDAVPRRSVLGDFFSTPSLVFLIGLCLFSPVLLWVLILSLTTGDGGRFLVYLALIPCLLALGVGLRHGLPFFRQRQSYKRVRRSLVLVNVWLVLELLMLVLSFVFKGQ